MLLIPSEKSKALSDVQPRKALSTICYRLLGNDRLSKDVQPSNAFMSITLMVFERTMEERFWQPAKANFPMVYVSLLVTTVFSDVLFVSALSGTSP